MSQPRRPAPLRAFSLLEVLIAIALVLALVGSMFAFLFDMLSSRARALDYGAKQLAATTLIERAEADLMSCLVGDSVSGSGVEGDQTRLRILTRGVPAPLAERGVEDPAVLGDLQVAEYRFNDETARIEARRAAVGDPDADASSFAPVGGQVHRIRFRYHDGTGWRESFDALAADRLPVAVEIAVWFDPPLFAEQAPEAPGAMGGSDLPERLTYDASGGFDERTFAERSDLDLFDEPRPDRFRVIAVPDAAPEGPDSDPGNLSDEEGLLAWAP
ncbi:MAG: hypothetical protein ACYS0G_10025 [Planctomycetota bacterium]